MTPQEAYDYIAGILPRFEADGATLFNQLHAASIIRGTMPDYADTTDADQLIADIQADINTWQSITNQLQPILSIFGYTGLGIDPATLVTFGAAMIAVAALLTAFYALNRIDQHSQVLQLLASKVSLTPDQQALVNSATTSTSIFGGLFSGLGSLGTYILIGGAIYLLIYFNKS